MKRLTLSALFLLGLTSIKAQEITCHIEGTTTDNETKNLILTERGKDIRTQENVITIPVVNGKFNYDLKSDVIRYYELIPDNQVREGNMRPAYIIAENQNVNIVFGTTNDKVITKGTGKETALMQQCENEVDAIYDKELDAIDEKRDSITNILEKEVEGMSEEQRQAYIKESPLFAEYENINKQYESVYSYNKIATAKWLDKHPCFYGLCKIMVDLDNAHFFKNSLFPYLLDSYKNTYSKIYEGHPYHETIKTNMKSFDLIPGNKYIDYDVCDTDGNQMKISSLYKGKIIYIDLWASWCSPCRRHAKALIPIYEKYKDKGFQIIAIAHERKVEDMTKALKADGYPWNSLIDLKDKNEIWLKNGLSNAGGGGYLIDSNGTILSVYPEADETERILKEKLGE